jgi:hypothetical protein
VLLQLKEAGRPVEPVYATEGTPLIVGPNGIFKQAPNSNAARLFQSFCFTPEVSKRKDSPYRSGRSPHWIKSKNPDAPAVKREAEEDWGRLPRHGAMPRPTRQSPPVDRPCPVREAHRQRIVPFSPRHRETVDDVASSQHPRTKFPAVLVGIDRLFQQISLTDSDSRSMATSDQTFCDGRHSGRDRYLVTHE